MLEFVEPPPQRHLRGVAAAKRVEGAGEKAGRPERRVPVRCGQVDHRAGGRNDVAGDGRDSEEDTPKEIDGRLPPSLAAAYREPAVPPTTRGSDIGDRSRHEEADRPTPIRAPDELVVLGARQRDVHRLVRGHVEEQRPGGLDDRRPPGCASAGLSAAPPDPAEPALKRATQSEEDGTDEEGDADGRVADELGVAGKRPDEEAGRPEREEKSHPAPTRHQGDPRAPGAQSEAVAPFSNATAS